jgi:hypothetical protein
MAATVSIPVSLTIGGGSAVEIGTIELALNADGTATLTTFDIAAALRETADALDAAGEDSDATP